MNNNDSKPVVSVLMSVYNGAPYLKEALDSIRKQTLTDWECIVIDDCSSDESPEILRDYALNDPRFKVYRNDSNQRLALSLNTAIQKACGKYYARMDADDISFPERFEVQVGYLEKNKECDIVSCAQLKINQNSELLEKRVHAKKAISAEKMKKVLLVGCPLTHPGIMVRSDVYKQLQGYRSFPVSEDLDFYLRAMTLNYNIELMSDVLMYYRVNENGMTYSNIYKTHVYGKLIRHYFRERKKKGIDGYNTLDFDKYNEINKLNDKAWIDLCNDNWSKLMLYKRKRNFIRLMILSLKNPWIMNSVVASIKYKIISRR